MPPDFYSEPHNTITNSVRRDNQYADIKAARHRAPLPGFARDLSI